jgi:hypothetical protein
MGNKILLSSSRNLPVEAPKLLFAVQETKPCLPAAFFFALSAYCLSDDIFAPLLNRGILSFSLFRPWRAAAAAPILTQIFPIDAGGDVSVK